MKTENIMMITAAVILPLSLYIGSTYYYYSPFYSKNIKAIAIISPTKGNAASGIAKFSQEKDGLHIFVKMTGLTPGLHGFHVHEFGNCACDDAVCAGSHYNPTNQKHGGPTDSNRHLGDFGNISADENGNAEYELVDTIATLNGPHSIIGRSVIVHADPDDFVTQSTGNSGARIAAGVIGIAQK